MGCFSNTGMSVRVLCFCFVLQTWLASSVGMRLYPCGDAGYQDVVENTAITFYCDQYTGSVDWKHKSPNSDSPRTLSTCPAPGSATSCTPSFGLPFEWTVTFISVTNSSLTTFETNRTPDESWEEYQCVSDGNTDKCGLHVIVTAVVSKPTTNIMRQDSGYTVSLSTDITRVFSSRGIYSCVWQLGTVRWMTAPDLDPPANNTDNLHTRSGGCDATIPLPSNPGDHYCSIMVNPGDTNKSCDVITIRRPSPPIISCPTDVIPENTSLTCTCNTDSMGQPGGRLRWYTGSGSDVSTEVISGNYDVSSLSMTWRVSRDDHNVRKFRCVNNWMVNISAQNDYTAQVAYPPTETILQASTNIVSMTINENEAVTLVCRSRGRPAPDLDLLQRDVMLARQDGGSVSEDRSQLTHRAVVGCHNTGTVTCRAENGVGDDQEAIVRLYVNCKPRGSTTEPETREVNFVNEPVSVYFHLEAFPLPGIFSFQYQGSSSSSSDSSSSSSSSSQPVPDSIQLRATCTNTFTDYAVLCIATVQSVQDSSAEGFYTFTAANAFGEESFGFRVKVNESSSSSAECEDPTSVYVVMAASVAVTLAVLAVVIFVLWRRRLIIFTCAGGTDADADGDGQGEGKGESRSVPPLTRQSQGDPRAERSMSDIYELTEGSPPPNTAEHQPSSVYSSLQTSDIGVPSVYSHISPSTTGGAGVEQGPVYENSGSETGPEYINLTVTP